MFERSTIISTNVLNILKKSPSPLSATKILEKLSQKSLKPNKATIYRILKKLLDKQVIAEITVRSGVTYYEFSKQSYHKHFICNQCEMVFCLDEYEIKIEKNNINQAHKEKKFTIQSYEFNIYGICDTCISIEKGVT